MPRTRLYKLFQNPPQDDHEACNMNERLVDHRLTNAEKSEHGAGRLTRALDKINDSSLKEIIGSDNFSSHEAFEERRAPPKKTTPNGIESGWPTGVCLRGQRKVPRIFWVNQETQK